MNTAEIFLLKAVKSAVKTSFSFPLPVAFPSRKKSFSKPNSQCSEPTGEGVPYTTLQKGFLSQLYDVSRLCGVSRLIFQSCKVGSCDTVFQGRLACKFREKWKRKFQVSVIHAKCLKEKSLNKTRQFHFLVRAENQAFFTVWAEIFLASKQAFLFTKRKLQLWGHIRRLSMCKHLGMSEKISHLGSRVTQCLSKCSYSL